MKLHSPAFERRLRRQVKQTIRRSPELKREASRTNRARHLNGRPIFRLVIAGLAATFIWNIAARTGHVTTALAFVGIWMLAWIPFQVQFLAHHLYASPDLSALSLLPVESRVVFRRQLEKFLRSASWLLVDLLAMLGTLALWAEIPMARWAALIPLVGLAWLTTLALVGLAMVHVRWLPYPLISSAIWIAAFVLMIAGSYVGPPLLAALDRSADTLRLMLPTAWPLSWFECLRPDASWFEVLFLIPSLALIWTLHHTVSRLASSYEFAEPLLAEPVDVLPGELTPAFNGTAETPRRVGLTSIAEFVETRGFLAPASWSQTGWFEARLWQWLTKRERRLAEFVFPEEIRVTAIWKKIFLHLAIGGAAGYALGRVNPAFQLWVWSGAMLLAALRALACFYSNGRAFSPIFCSGVNIQLHAVYPVGYRELSRVLFKYSLIQLPLLAGLLTVCGVGLSELVRYEWMAGAVLGFKLAFLLAAARCIFVTFAFSAGTNDSTRLRFRTFALVGMMLFIGGLFLGLAVAGVLVPQPLLAAALWLGAMVTAWLFWRGYGWFYNANRFDVMNLPRPET